MSNPDLSIDEITSTRLSLDDQAILTSLPKNVNPKQGGTRNDGGRTGIGSLWEDNSGRLRKMTKRLKTLPNGLFARKDRESSHPSSEADDHPDTSESTLPQPELAANSCPSTTPAATPDNVDSARVSTMPPLVCGPSGSSTTLMPLQTDGL
jgi:hypothetical protein